MIKKRENTRSNQESPEENTEGIFVRIKLKASESFQTAKDYLYEHRKQIGAILVVGGGIVAAIWAGSKSSGEDTPDLSAEDGTGYDGAETPELSAEVYNNILIYLGEGKANEVADDVRIGERDAEEAEDWINSHIEMREKSRNRREIYPSEWRKFEDGWSPPGWFD
jgi:hypothetical protein